MRRLTILLGVLAALMLVPAAQAFAAGTMTVHPEGTGSGEISSVGGAEATGSELFEGAGNTWEGSPPITCSYNGAATSGTCATPLVLEESFRAIALHAVVSPGSEFAGWHVEGADVEDLCGTAEFAKETGCVPFNFKLNEGNISVTAYFCAEGTALPGEEVGCEEAPAGPELTVTKEGGEGTVVSNPAGIECGGTCSASFTEGSKVTLTASPASGYMFSSWKGCDKGGAIGRQCTITMSAAKSAVAKFIPSYSVSVTKAGSGLGKVQSSPGGVLCLVNCSSTSAEFKGGASVSLTAAPSKHFHLVKWTGDCSGTGACSFPSIAANHTVGAEFAEDAQFALTLNKAGGGNGTVKADVAGINCGATCTTQAAKYYTGTEVTLTATPGKGSSLKEWTGACTGSGTCKVTLSAAKTVGAKFE